MRPTQQSRRTARRALSRADQNTGSSIPRPPAVPRRTPSPARQSRLERTAATLRGTNTETPRTTSTSCKISLSHDIPRHNCSSGPSTQNVRRSSTHIPRALPPKARADSRSHTYVPMHPTQTQMPQCGITMLRSQPFPRKNRIFSLSSRPFESLLGGNPLSSPSSGSLRAFRLSPPGQGRGEREAAAHVPAAHRVPISAQRRMNFWAAGVRVVSDFRVYEHFCIFYLFRNYQMNRTLVKRFLG